MVTEEDGTFVKTSKWEVHLLEVILKSEQILEILQKTTAEAALGTTDRQHPDLTADGKANNEPQQQENRQEETHMEDMAQRQPRDKQSSTDQDRDSDGQQTPPGVMLRLLAADGSEFCVPREVGSLLAELIAKVKSLEDIVLNQQRHAASITHIAEHRTGHNVQFEDTYTVHNADEWTGLPPTPPPARRDGQADLRGVHPAWVGGDCRSSARGPSWPNYSKPGATKRFSRSSMFHSRDIDQVVRKWQIRFSGAKSRSIDVFLARLEDCRVLANLSEEEVLSSLSELFTDTAATWYRHKKEKWTT